MVDGFYQLRKEARKLHKFQQDLLSKQSNMMLDADPLLRQSVTSPAAFQKVHEVRKRAGEKQMAASSKRRKEDIAVSCYHICVVIRKK